MCGRRFGDRRRTKLRWGARSRTPFFRFRCQSSTCGRRSLHGGSLIRCSAGVYFRSDSMQGLLLGEQQALGLLADYSRTYNERFDGFALTTLAGRRVLIANGAIHA